MKKYLYVALGLAIIIIGTFVWRQKPVSDPLAPLDPDYLQPVHVDQVVGVSKVEGQRIDVTKFGAPFRPSEFSTSLSQSFTEGHANTTVKVASITTKDGYTLDPLILGDTIVLHISPNKANAEIVVCTGLTVSTKTFTGCTFGYRFDKNTSVSTNILAHAPGETVIISNDDHYQTTQYPTLDSPNVFTGANTVATSTDADPTSPLVKLYFGTAGASSSTATYLWMNRNSGTFGFATAAQGELAFNTGGTTFTAVNPLRLVGGEAKLSTSTFDFVMRDSTLLGLASSTISSGTASGSRLDLLFNTRFNSTTTKEQLTVNTASSTSLVIGTGQPTSAFTHSGLWFDNATSTQSVDLTQICFAGANCYSTPNQLSSSNYYYFTGGAMGTSHITGVGGASGTVNSDPVATVITTGTGTNNEVTASTTAAVVTTGNFDYTFRGQAGGTSSQFEFFGISDTTNIKAEATGYASDHVIGFELDNAKLHAVNSNGANSTSWSIAGITTTNFNEYRIVKTGSSVAFFVNGTLQRTLSTTTPSITNGMIIYGVDTQTNAAKTATVYSNWLFFGPK